MKTKLQNMYVMLFSCPNALHYTITVCILTYNMLLSMYINKPIITTIQILSTMNLANSLYHSTCVA